MLADESDAALLHDMLSGAHRGALPLTLCLITASLLTGCQSPESSRQEFGWERAEAVWRPFAAEHLATALERMPEENLEWIEYRSPSIRALLPGFRFYALTGHRNPLESSLFVLSQSGKIIDLEKGDGWFVQGMESRNERLVSFLAAQEIILDDAQRAVAFAEMFERLSAASSLVTFGRDLATEESHHTVFEDPGGSGFWELTPRREESMWVIHSEYVGPPGVGGVGPVYELTVDAEHRLIDVRRVYPMVPPADGPVVRRRSWVEDPRTGRITRR